MSTPAPPHSASEELQADLDDKVSILISSDLHSRALIICQRRNCTLEGVLEDLIVRFLPRVDAHEDNEALPPRDTPIGQGWSRWARRRRKSK